MAVVGPASNVILDLAETQAELGETNATPEQIQRWIDAVTELIEEDYGPVLLREAVTEVRSSGDVVLEGRVTSVTSVLRSDREVTGYTLDAKAGVIEPPYCGSLAGATITYTVGLDPIPAAMREAAILAVQHAEETNAGAVPIPYGGGTDQTFVLGSGFFLPNRSKELLAPWRRGPERP